MRALVEVRGHGAAHHVADEVDEVAEGVGHRVFTSGCAGARVELELFDDGAADDDQGARGRGGGGGAAPCRLRGLHGVDRGEQQGHVLGWGPGHDAEDGHKLDSQHALAGRDDPQNFGGGVLGALEHFPHPINGGRDDGKRKRPLALGEQLVHVGVGSGELEGLGRIRGLLGGFLFLDGLPLGRGLDDVAEGGVDLGVDPAPWGAYQWDAAP